MRKVWTAAILAAAVAIPAVSHAGDKSQSTFVNPVATGTGAPVDLGTKTVAAGIWTNGTSKGKTQGDDKCKIQMQLQKMTIPDSDQTPGTGDEVICISDSKLNVAGAPLTTTTILRGEIKKGQVKIKYDLAAEGTGCFPAKSGGPGVASYESRTTCYAPDPTYNPALTIALASDGTSGIVIGSSAPHPSSGIIAVDGIFFAP